MRLLKKDEMEQIIPLTLGWQETLIWSVLEGCMGKAWADRLPDPRAVKIEIGDFIFFAGDSTISEAEQLVRHRREEDDNVFKIYAPQNESWGKLIESVYGEEAQSITRYAIKKEGDIFDRNKLGKFVHSLPRKFQIVPIDEAIFFETKQESWCQDLCSQFSSYEEYREKGIGFVVLYRGSIVSGASSYTYYNEGIEIEIDTKEAYRRKKLATACAARLILECLAKGLYPSWDAANLYSVALAEKLGYHFDHEYKAYVVRA